MDWIKATVRSVYLEKGGCPFPPINAKWNTPDEAADGPYDVCKLYDDRDIHPVTMSITQVMINAVVQGALLHGHPM